jgi:hypothetical protein
MRMCAELADLGMALAHAVAARALTDWSEPEQPPAAEPLYDQQPAEPLSEPQPAPSDRTPEPNTNRAPSLRAPTPYLRAPTCKPVDPALLFTRLAATVRDCIALEARLAAGTPPTARVKSLLLHADPRRAPLRDILRRVTEKHPDRPELLKQATIHLDEELAADAAQITDQATILFAICQELAIEIDFATLPDAYLDLILNSPDTPPPDD